MDGYNLLIVEDDLSVGNVKLFTTFMLMFLIPSVYSYMIYKRSKEEN